MGPGRGLVALQGLTSVVTLGLSLAAVLSTLLLLSAATADLDSRALNSSLLQAGWRVFCMERCREKDIWGNIRIFVDIWLIDIFALGYFAYLRGFGRIFF